MVEWNLGRGGFSKCENYGGGKDETKDCCSEVSYDTLGMSTSGS
jgi:hypothetical protein